MLTRQQKPTPTWGNNQNWGAEANNAELMLRNRIYPQRRAAVEMDIEKTGGDVGLAGNTTSKKTSIRNKLKKHKQKHNRSAELSLWVIFK